MSLSFFADPGLSQPISTLSAVLSAAGDAPADAVVYLGSPETGFQYHPTAGEDINVSVSDADPGSGPNASHVALALAAAGLASATPGAALPIGSVISAGSGSSVAIYLRILAPALPVGRYDDLALSVSALLETPNAG